MNTYNRELSSIFTPIAGIPPYAIGSTLFTPDLPINTVASSQPTKYTALQDQILYLIRQRDEHTNNLYKTHKQTMDFLNAALLALLLSLANILQSFWAMIMYIIEHLGELSLSQILERIGEGITAVVQFLKSFNMTTDGMAFNNLPEIATIMGDLNDQIVGIGNDLVSLGNLIGVGGDITFDMKDLSFHVKSFGGQLAEVTKAINSIKNRISETEANFTNAISNISITYKIHITYNQELLAELNKYDDAVDSYETLALNAPTSVTLRVPSISNTISLPTIPGVPSLPSTLNNSTIPA